MFAHNVERQSAQGGFSAQGRGMRHCFFATGLPGWMRAQRGMRAFGGYGCAISTDERTFIRVI